jgi:8-oxo-dGTP pyrophosphatase MutT (NUDIX family)
MAQPATPYPASTVVLLRPGANDSFEIYMNRRPAEMDTYAGVYVFPGGRVEKKDWSEEMIGLTRGLTPNDARAALAVELQPELCLGHWVAAVRELFEEAGIHFFVRQRDPKSKFERQLSAWLAEKRSTLQRGEIDFPTLLASQDLCCDVSSLAYFYHRVTPEHYPVRFDTRFYLAALPPDQSPLHASEEVSESLWISPKDALGRFETGKFPMMPPTLTVLRNLFSHQSWPALRAAFNLR